MPTRRLFALLTALALAPLIGCDFVKSKTALAGLERLPAFPEPAPEPVASLELPPDVLLEPPPESLGTIHERLAEVLETAGFEKWLVYAYQDGFAMAARWEQIEQDGSPADRRFPARQPAMKRGGFDLDHHAQVLFNAPPGDYRLVVFTVVGTDGQPSDEVAIEGDEVDAGELPAPLAHKVADGPRVTAHIYLRHRQGSGPAEPMASELGAAEHLVAAGLFTSSELGAP